MDNKVDKDVLPIWTISENAIPIFILTANIPATHQNILATIMYYRDTNKMTAGYRFRNDLELTKSIYHIKTGDGELYIDYSKNVFESIKNMFENTFGDVCKMGKGKISTLEINKNSTADGVYKKIKLSDLFDCEEEKAKE